MDDFEKVLAWTEYLTDKTRRLQRELNEATEQLEEARVELRNLCPHENTAQLHDGPTWTCLTCGANPV